MKKLLLIISIITSLLIVSACDAETGEFSFGGATATPDQTPTPLPTPVKVFQATISADGQVVLPIPPQVFSFQSSGLSGTLEEIYVIPGEYVKQGDLMARIDDTELRRALQKAEAALASTRAQIDKEEAPALAGDIAEARSNLAASQADLLRLQDLPSEEAITQAAADLRLREVDLRRAQEAYDEVAYAQGLGMSPQAAELQQATLNYERAQAVYDEATKPATDADLAKARASIAQAQNRLDQLLSGVSSETQAVNNARLKETILSVEEARDNLAKAQMFAPWNGLVTEVNASPGVSTQNASVTLAQVEPLRFATSNFSERNLKDIEEGSAGTIYLKSHPNVPMPAVVQRIELESTQKDGDTALFTVIFDFNSGEFEVRPGMTGRVEIAVDPES